MYECISGSQLELNIIANLRWLEMGFERWYLAAENINQCIIYVGRLNELHKVAGLCQVVSHV